jgi:hypothetical protein
MRVAIFAPQIVAMTTTFSQMLYLHESKLYCRNEVFRMENDLDINISLFFMQKMPVFIINCIKPPEVE